MIILVRYVFPSPDTEMTAKPVPAGAWKLMLPELATPEKSCMPAAETQFTV